MKWVIQLLLVFLAKNVYSQQRITPDYLFNTDPTAHIIDGRYWLFVCHDQSSTKFIGPEDYWHNIMDYHAYSTTDFLNWRNHGSIFSIHDIPWASDFPVWDSDAGIEVNGKYYAYVTVRKGNFGIAVLEADKPEGPYKDVLNKPFITEQTLLDQGILPEREGQKFGVISPTIIYDNDSIPYLYFGQFRFFMVRLKKNMIEMDGNIREIDVPLKGGEATEFIEEASITKINSKYYLTYLTYKDWEGKRNNYFKTGDPSGPYVQYCVADNLWGPYKNPQHLIYPFDSASCNNAAYISKYKNKWVLAYQLPYKGMQHRQIAITELTINKDGSLQPVFPKADKGIVPGKRMKVIYDAFVYKREAEEFFDRKEAYEERGIKQDFHFKLKKDGYLMFKDIDFGEGAKSFKISVSCENSKIKKARVEFRLDSPTGKLIGSADVGFTYWITYYKEITGAINNVTGVHDLYIVAKGENGDAYGRLFNVNWFTFAK
ncbi:MAG TPA: carbohydrate-binding protein [Flavisolibacter sp.]|nr:carbohydrate-binding protein [Flavisolibacter sp.]